MSLTEPLLPETQSNVDEYSSKPVEVKVKLSALQPCANFLLNCELDKWYKGEIHKNDDVSKQEKGWDKIKSYARSGFTGIGMINEYSKFISHKFQYELDSTVRTFCITFRKEPRLAKIYNVLGGNDSAFLIRLSLIEEKENSGGDALTKIKCNWRESLILEPTFFARNGIEIPTKENAKFSSITSGQTHDQVSVVIGMTPISDHVNRYKVFFESHILPHMKTLGKLLVDHCTSENTASQGGATRKHTRLSRRRKSVFKRKGKKSYRKKKYGKTKKSRRFRRSIRSRR